MSTAMNTATLSPAATQVLVSLLEARTGQQTDATRVWRIGTALKPLLRELDMQSFDALVAALVAPGAAALADRVVDALLNQETSFFRDALVIESVATAIEQLDAAEPNRRPRIWSAGCSGGQEIYSLAMTLLDRGNFRCANLPELLGTDVSANTVTRARLGQFSQFEVQRGLPIRTLMRWFEPAGETWTIRREIARAIKFRQHNLVDGPMPPGLFDIVMCRNVLLYFPQQMREQVLERLARSIRPDGLLVLGAGETVLGLSDAFDPCQQFRGLYRRRADPPAMAARQA
jgi:chemotaxis protein methyltransferase CheR